MFCVLLLQWCDMRFGIVFCDSCGIFQWFSYICSCIVFLILILMSDIFISVILILVAVLPALVLMVYISRQDHFNKEPLGMLLKAFFFGVLSTLPAVLIESCLVLFTPGTPVLDGLFNGFCVAGFTEELCKCAFLLLAVWKSSHFDEYFDGIVYSAYVALGFACFENMGYVFMQDTLFGSLATGTMRAVLSVPGHFLFGVVMGYYVALAKFEPRHRRRNLFRAVFYPMLLHGTFDSLLMIPESFPMYRESISVILFVVFIFFDIKMWKWGVRRIRVLQYLSHKQEADRNSVFKDFHWDV